MRSMTLDIFGFLGAGRLGSEAAQVQCFAWAGSWPGRLGLGHPARCLHRRCVLTNLGRPKLLVKNVFWAVPVTKWMMTPISTTLGGPSTEKKQDGQKTFFPQKEFYNKGLRLYVILMSLT